MADEVERKIRILVVEDNPADVQLLRWALEKVDLKCRMTVLEDGGKALEFARQDFRDGGSHGFDLAVVDLNLPRNDGIEVLAAIRANPAFSDLPVVMLSSSSSPRDRRRLEAFSSTRYIIKPPSLEEYQRVGALVKELWRDRESSAASTGP